jgi:hypothetical protein
LAAAPEWGQLVRFQLDANATVPNEPFFFKDYLADNWVVDPVVTVVFKMTTFTR